MNRALSGPLRYYRFKTHIEGIKKYTSWINVTSGFPFYLFSLLGPFVELAGSVETGARRNSPRDHHLCLQQQQQSSFPQGTSAERLTSHLYYQTSQTHNSKASGHILRQCKWAILTLTNTTVSQNRANYGKYIYVTVM